jgi:hypothetical protein
MKNTGVNDWSESCCRWGAFIADNPATLIALRRRDLLSSEMLLRCNDPALAERVNPPLREILEAADDDERDIGPDLKTWFRQMHQYQQEFASRGPAPTPLLSHVALFVWGPVLALPRSLQDLVVEALLAAVVASLVYGSYLLYEISPVYSCLPGVLVLLALLAIAISCGCKSRGLPVSPKIGVGPVSKTPTAGRDYAPSPKGQRERS